MIYSAVNKLLFNFNSIKCFFPNTGKNFVYNIDLLF